MVVERGERDRQQRAERPRTQDPHEEHWPHVDAVPGAPGALRDPGRGTLELRLPHVSATVLKHAITRVPLLPRKAPGKHGCFNG